MEAAIMNPARKAEPEWLSTVRSVVSIAGREGLALLISGCVIVGVVAASMFIAPAVVRYLETQAKLNAQTMESIRVLTEGVEHNAQAMDAALEMMRPVAAERIQQTKILGEIRDGVRENGVIIRRHDDSVIEGSRSEYERLKRDAETPGKPLPASRSGA